MSQYTVAVVGTGPDPANPTVEGFAMGYRHAEAFRNDDRCRLVACADLVPEHAAAFADEFGLDETAVFADYERMVASVEPDVVSVAVPPAAHEEVVVGCARAGAVEAVHCEKPMALTLRSAERMVQACWRRGVQLTFNRQRRFGKPFTEAARLVEEGAVGDLERVEIGWGDFFDTGAHAVDLAGMFAGDRPAEWVIAQLDYRDEDVRFGAHQENQMFAQWRYENGVHGVLSTGEGSGLVDAPFHLRGSDGEIRIGGDPMLELRRGDGWEAVDVGGETMHGAPGDADRFGSSFHDRSVAAVVDALDSGEESALSGRTGLNTAEILFGGYESVRRRGRVDLPLDIDDSPLEAMVESGALSPEPASDPGAE
ncbi:Gfo/Idh/MocA family protein [Candidatus Halobonum tyrrellensis]|uniref:Oxidoreductase domain protein n=1 Tax=Candidatus Halobonum tyrrellensis G22 TaxID=1324957 RepID=V4IUT1_9EURY|nr:Gfo/Idh/MocA family oxidoreductase [Candidatus Halobonum tyrrellensis]ESP86957.1 oxidoreductase domain protein [Candidatus Halobonum tyrrellensis G22]